MRQGSATRPGTEEYIEPGTNPARQIERSGADKRYRRGNWQQTDVKRVQMWDPIEMPAAWMTFELQQALAAIQEPHARKKRVTVMRMAEAKASGLSIRSVFEQPDTCGTSAWYGQGGDPGWKDDPLIGEALRIATARAHWWYDQEEAQRLALRQRQLSVTQDEIVDLTRLATDTLADLMLNATSDKVRLEAAEAILDRADEATAKKIVTQSEVVMTDHKGPRMSDIRNRQRVRAEQGLEHYEDEAPVDEAHMLSTLPDIALPEGDVEEFDIEDYEAGEDDSE